MVRIKELKLGESAETKPMYTRAQLADRQHRGFRGSADTRLQYRAFYGLTKRHFQGLKEHQAPPVPQLPLQGSETGSVHPLWRYLHSSAFSVPTVQRRRT